MKTIYLIGGTMGVGKTTLGQYLKKELNNAIYLDGDWCWDAHPFIVNDVTKKMVMNNICFLLNSYIQSNCYENIIFTWVMHEQSIIDEIVENLDLKDYTLKTISLVCDKRTLENHIRKDVQNHIRDIEVLERSLARLDLYQKLDTIKIDVSNQTLEEIYQQMKNSKLVR